VVPELAPSNFGVNFHKRSTIAQRVTPLLRQLHSLLGQAPANRNGHIFLPIFNLPRELAAPNFSAHARILFSVRIPFNASCSLFVSRLISRVLRLGVDSND